MTANSWFYGSIQVSAFAKNVGVEKCLCMDSPRKKIYEKN